MDVFKKSEISQEISTSQTTNSMEKKPIKPPCSLPADMSTNFP